MVRQTKFGLITTIIAFAVATGFASDKEAKCIRVPSLVGAVAPCAGAEWKLDFASSRPPMHWWSPAKQDNTCSLTYVTNAATGRQALEAYWDGKGTRMYVFQQPLVTPMAPFDRLLVRVKLSSDTPLPGVRGCRVRIQDTDTETFYVADTETFCFSDPLRQQRVWRARGERELSFMLDEKSLARAKAIKHGTNGNDRIDFPLKSFGMSFTFHDGAAPMRIRLDEISCTPLPKAAQELPEYGLFEPLYDAATVPMLVPRDGCAVARVQDAATGCAAIELSNPRPVRDFGFDFCRYGSPMGALAPKLPAHEVGELVIDVANSRPLDGVNVRLIDMGSNPHTLRMEVPELALPGRHTISFKLPASIISKGHWNKGKSFGFFALGGIGFHASVPATGAVVRVSRVSMRYRARPADALALELDTGTLPRIVAPDAASRGVKVVVRNVTDRALAFDVALRLADVRDDDAGWSLSERMAFGPGEAKMFRCPVPTRYGVYYVNMTACPPDGGMLDESERQRAFGHFRPVGATPDVKDAPGFCFGSVCHLTPYFGNEAEIVRMADAMALVGLKILRTDFRTWWDSDYEWYDKIVDIFSARGINFDFILGAICHPDGTPDLEKSRTAYRTAFARYKGRVKFWEMLNEPDGDWGREHPLRAPGYVQLARQTAADLRELDPSAQFMSAGFCCFDHKIMGTFQRDAMAACWRVFDLHCFHGHGQYAGYRTVIDDKLLPMRKELGIAIPWYANETALTMSNGTGEKTQAEALVKKLLFSWSRGAKGYNWYNMRGKGENPLEGEHGYGMLTMRLDPRAVYCAWNTLTGLCRGKEFAGEVACGDDISCFLLKGADGLVAGIWRERPGSARLALKISSSGAVTSDIYGNRKPCPVIDGKLELDVSDEPVWLLLPPCGDFAPASVPVSVAEGRLRLAAQTARDPQNATLLYELAR